jgi:hypothetical protein
MITAKYQLIAICTPLVILPLGSKSANIRTLTERLRALLVQRVDRLRGGCRLWSTGDVSLQCALPEKMGSAKSGDGSTFFAWAGVGAVLFLGAYGMPSKCKRREFHGSILSSVIYTAVTALEHSRNGIILNKIAVIK